ncbi:hypothetical protein MKW98_004053 [Papaver atlanticum]|uniref:Uncharacterized protein n=1 Tax=Papaver atlanticum TaxID=357466 RepID=A0AAD4T1A2_9MAGN|nr:hypothetical protein MKW98_004053 [Papaver atlanticum]
MRVNEIEEENSNVKNKKGTPTNPDCIDTDGVKPNIKPIVGMGFKSQAGFPVMKSKFKKNVAGEIRCYIFTCARAGKRDSVSEKKLQPQATIKFGCLAKLVLR